MSHALIAASVLRRVPRRDLSPSRSGGNSSMRVVKAAEPGFAEFTMSLRSSERRSASGRPGVTATTMRGSGWASESAAKAWAEPVKDETQYAPPRQPRGGEKRVANI